MAHGETIKKKQQTNKHTDEISTETIEYDWLSYVWLSDNILHSVCRDTNQEN